MNELAIEINQRTPATKFSLEQRINKLTKSKSSLHPSQYIALLRDCAEQRCAAGGKFLHWHIVANGCGLDRYLKNHLIFMYARCGCLDSALDVFSRMPNPNVFSWTALITAHVQADDPRGAIVAWWQMLLDGGAAPDAFVFSSVLAACAAEGLLSQGRAVHRCAIAAGLERGVVGNAIVNMYGKCGKVGEAKQVFERLPERNVVSWNAIIAANAQNRLYRNAMEAFHAMDLDGVARPDDATFVSIVDACSGLLDLRRGAAVHERAARTGFASHLVVGNALVSMYGRCGSVGNAKVVFDEMIVRDVFSWTSIIAAYAQSGRRRDAVELYQAMALDGIAPNDITFVSVLFACGHSGLVYQAREFFVSMVGDHCIPPTVEHFGCMIDLLGRAGWISDANQLINSSPLGSRSLEWLALLGACKMHGDTNLASTAAKQVFAKNPRMSSSYMLLLESK